MFERLFRKKNFDPQLDVTISRAEVNFRDVYKKNSILMRRISAKIDRINIEFNNRYNVDLFVNYAASLNGCYSIIDDVTKSSFNFTSLSSLLNGSLNVAFFRNYLGRRFSCNANRCGLRDFIQDQDFPIGCVFDNIDIICLLRNALDHPENINLKERAEIQISSLLFRRGNSKLIEDMNLNDFQKLWLKSLSLANDALIDLNKLY